MMPTRDDIDDALFQFEVFFLLYGAKQIPIEGHKYTPITLNCTICPCGKDGFASPTIWMVYALKKMKWHYADTYNGSDSRLLMSRVQTRLSCGLQASTNQDSPVIRITIQSRERGNILTKEKEIK